MKIALSIAFSLVVVSAASAQNISVLDPGTTLPIRFSHAVDAAHAHKGDAVETRTTQPVKLASGKVIPAGAKVIGTIVSSDRFAFDKTPYAKQENANLAIQFTSLISKDAQLPLNVYVRAIADPVTAQAATLPNLYDDSLRTRQQIGGDYVTPSQREVVAADGDTVGYLKRGGVYAHLISANGNSADGCDAGDTEQPVGLFAASACGIYGFVDVTLAGTGRREGSSTLTLVSRRHSPKIWANSVALLEVTSPSSALATR